VEYVPLSNPFLCKVSILRFKHKPNGAFDGFLNGPILASFCLISSFPHDSIQIQVDKSLDGVLGTRTRGCRMEGADESTELVVFYNSDKCCSGIRCGIPMKRNES